MKVHFPLLSLFAFVNAEYIFDITKYNDQKTVDMTCTFNESSETSTNIEVKKYSNFLKNSTYTRNVFECNDTSFSSKCISKVNETLICETGYEGEFCRNYGGSDKLINCD